MSATILYNAAAVFGHPGASAIGLQNGRIAIIGQRQDILAAMPAAQKIDMEGAAVYPGFVDAHIHMQGHGFNLERIALKGLTSLDACLSVIAARIADLPENTWVQGRGWNYNLWTPSRHPSRADLDRICPHRPVALSSVDGHLLWANSGALTIAGITAQTPDSDGGHIYRDASGAPTGILAERAIGLVTRHIPPPTDRERRIALQQAVKSCLSAGLTGAHDCDGGLTRDGFHDLRANGDCPFRVCLMIPVAHLGNAIAAGWQTGEGDAFLRTGPVKIFADGALGPRTAAVLEPYVGTRDTGIVVTSRAELIDIARRAFPNGLDIAVHAIGDRSVRDVLDAVETTAPVGRRPRIEHAQITHPSDIPRFARLGVIASMQPIHATADMHIADRYLGPGARWAYAWKSIQNTGAILAFGSDSPVEPHCPLVGIHAALTRQDAAGQPEGGWYPQECISVADAIRAYTFGAAYAAGLEKETGAIAPGKLADITVLSHDLAAIPPEDILHTRVLLTLVNGQIAYDGR